MKSDAQPLETDSSSIAPHSHFQNSHFQNSHSQDSDFQGASQPITATPSFTLFPALPHPAERTIASSQDASVPNAAQPQKPILHLPTWQPLELSPNHANYLEPELSPPLHSAANSYRTNNSQPTDRQGVTRSLSFTLVEPPAPPSANPDAVLPFAVSTDPNPLPELPRFKLPHFGQHRHITNPEFALGLLKEMEGIVVGWQKELQQVLLKIQDLYLEGSVIDGWLESKPYEPQAHGAAVLRHAEIDRLMDYVEEICHPSAADKPAPLRPGYRLCGLDADGQLWSRPCPSERVPQVSLAIARYQRLRQYLARRYEIESRLDRLAQSLITVRSELPEK